MGKWHVQFGSKTFDAFMKNSAKVVTEMNDVFLKETWDTALKMVGDLDAAYDEYISKAKDYKDLSDEQVEIYNRNKSRYKTSNKGSGERSHDWLKLEYDEELDTDVYSFNTLRGTNTAVKAYATYSKNTGIITVGVTGPDILYMEYGTGDIGQESDDAEEIRAAAADAGINLKPYNSGPTIRNEDGINYWTYHSSVHFGMPAAGAAYKTMSSYKKNIAEATKIALKTYLKSAYSGKDIK